MDDENPAVIAQERLQQTRNRVKSFLACLTPFPCDSFPHQRSKRRRRVAFEELTKLVSKAQEGALQP